MQKKPKKSVDTIDRVDQVAVMRARGYVPAPEIANKMGVSLPTIARWAVDGLVDSEIVAAKRYIKLTSLIEHIGENQAEIFGFTPKKKAGGAK